MPLTKVVNGEVVELTSEEESAVLAERKSAVASKRLEGVRQERDRRLKADFTFNGVQYQRDPVSLQRITGAATLAGFAIASGAKVGNLRWANPDRDFVWISSDDTPVPMDAQTCFAFGQAAANVETSLILAAKVLREMNPVPEDYKDSKWWS